MDSLQKSVLVIALGISLSANAAPVRWSMQIDAVDPGYVNAGTPSILLISGKHLGRYRHLLNCDFAPIAGPVLTTGCSVDYIEASGQLEVHLQSTDPAASSDYILRFCKVDKSGRIPSAGCENNGVIKLATIIHVVKPTNSTTAPTNPVTTPSPANPTPFTDCLNANATASPALTSRGSAGSVSVNCAASLMTESEVTDNFGRHVDKTYFAIQVRVSNQNSNYDFLLRDILLTLPDGRVISSRIRRFAQGVAVKGKSLDRRAVFYNSLQALGSLYGGLAIFASTGFQAAGNALQGPLMQGFSQIFPDTTTDNVNRFNTAVFDDQNPSIVPKDSIGQPPLYVVALVPKTGNAEADTRFGERIAVSLEGTYIKQVSLVSISPSSLKYDPEYISPMITPNDPAVVALRNASESKRIQISNNNSTVMNISGIRLLTGDGKESQDFEIDPKKTTCGAAGGNQTNWDSKAKFSIAAQSFCDVWIRTTPQTPGPVSATLVVEGDNLDGSKTVYLEGQGVGIIYDLAHGDLKKDVPYFACSYSDTSCPPIPLEVITTSSWKFPVYYYLPAGASSLQLSWQQKGKAAVTSCNGVTSSPNGSGGRCEITLDLSDPSGNAGLTLTGNNWTSAVNFTYQTTPTSLVMTAPSPATPIPVNSPVPIMIEVQDKTGKVVSTLPEGTQIEISIAGCQNNANGPFKVPTKGGVTVPGTSFTAIAPGVCRVDATMPATGSYGEGKLSTVNLTAVPAASVIATTAPTTAIDHTKSFDIPLTVVRNPAIPGVTCGGSISYVAPAGLGFDTGGPLALSSGAGKLTVTSGMAAGQTYTITFKYSGDEKACGAAPDKTFQFSTQ